MANITPKAGKTESYDAFLERFTSALDHIKDMNKKYANDKDLLFIPVNQILTETIGVHTTHGMRDFLAKGVKDGDQKLQLILQGDAQNETQTINEMIRHPQVAYAYTKLINQYYNLREQRQDISLDENEAVKDSIKLTITPDASFKVDN